ncbi:MAG: pilus assembly protein PilM [Rhodospirillales bacterium]|jgi:general secretion pathway protein L|nr:pilus assembly protein PilM [Rhodospirillales bacterium]
MMRSLGPALDVFRRGVDWWIGELRGMLPARLRQLMTKPGPDLIVDVADDRVIVRHGQDGERRELAQLIIAGLSAEARRAQLATLLPGSETKASRDAAVRLPAARVLRRTIDLPAAASENLAEVLAIDIDRQTPFTAEQVYFDHVAREIDRKEGRVLVELVAAPRELVDGATAIARELGLVPRFVEVAWPGGDGPRVNLMPRTREAGGPAFLRPLTVALAALAVGLAVAAVAVPLRQRGAVAEALREQVAEQRKRAEAVQRLETEIEQLSSQRRFLVARRAARPLTVEVLDELTSVVPDDTWLFRLRTADREVQIFGYSASATALIGLIEQAPLFEDAQFRAPLTRDARTDAERLHIGFRFLDRAGS